MRAFCTVSAPLEVCASSAEQLSPGSRFLALRLLGNQQPKTLYFLVDAKSRVREVYTQTCLHFATQGMQDTELFGLAVLIDGEYMFADPESKLSKYGPKSWRSSHTHGLDANGRPLLELHFRVQFYIESPFMLKDEPSRHNYYLQLKYNALKRDILREYSEQSMILLAGLALQADYGDAPLTTLKTTSTTATTTLNTTTTTSLTPTALLKTKPDEGNATEAAISNANVANGSGSGSSGSSGDSSNDGNTKSTTTSNAAKTTAATSFTTTLPKISKKTNSANERMLRLSTYVASTSQQQTPTNGAAITSATATTASSSSVFPISGSIKRGLGAMAATLSPSSSLLALNRGQKAAAVVNATQQVTETAPAADIPTAAEVNHSAADYFRLEDYLPAGLRTMWAANALRACHRENRGMSASDAELHYIQQACLVHESINAHTFRMRMSKSENGPGNSWFVIYAKGIKIFDGSENLQPQQQPQHSLHQQQQPQQRKQQHQQQQTTFLWPNITKLSFERKKFEIRSGDSKIVLYATSDEKNKMLLTLCKETHQFSMKMAARLKEIIKRDDEENNCLHACYNYSRSLHLTYKNKSDQRISVISSTSSNTTSGIVSDRVHSEDELEIMINSPPAPIAAPSTESLALAHLLDHPSVSRQTSSVGQVSLKELEEQLAALSVRQAQKQHGTKLSKSISGDSPIQELSIHSAGNSFSSGSIPTASQRTADSSGTTESPNSQHNIGSQCSSTCSTVVVTSQTEPASNVFTSMHRDGHVTTATSTPTQRRNSTSSSLELGFSHTAQNSTLSEAESSCIEHNFSASTQDGTESISGVYTLAHGAPPTETSGVYTMHSSEMTGQSSEIAESENQSSHYGSFHPAKSEISDDHLREDHADSVDGSNYVQTVAGKRLKNDEFRLRSDSNISTSGSFRGDGSDPTDNKHNLLTAEELTELIVGRGSYPSRKTVSNNMDSDCDYVTLPLSIAGESYIQGHQDTAPTEDQVEQLLNDLLLTEPPAPPQRIDSNNMPPSTHASLSNIRMRSPPPYNARHETTGLRGPLVRSSMPAQQATINAPQTAGQGITTAVLPPPASHTKVPSKVAIKAAEKAKTEKCVDKPAAVQPVQAFNQSNVAIRRRDPPPYPVGSKPRPTSLVSVAPSVASNEIPMPTVGGSTTSLKSEEATARFITSRPQINILKAHASVVNESAKPCYAAPTHCSSATSSIGSISNYHIPSHLSQNSTHNSNYASGSQVSLNLANHLHSIAPKTHAATAAGVIPSTIGIPIVPYGLHGAHKSMSSLHHQPPPYAEIKPTARPTCVLLPVIKSRQFIPPPPPSLPRQPPPPPPPQLGVYATSQLARKQLELYQQQLYSDVDYVIYPIQDPAVSQQEYIDAKQSSLLAAMAQAAPPPPHSYLAAYHTTSPHPGPWDTCKGHAIYRSTPYLPLALSAHSRYASTQNLSDTYVQLPSAYSPLYSPSVASLCSSYEPPPPPPLHPAALTAAANQSNYFARSRSDDNILNTLDALPKMKRLPPPPPPPYVNRRLKKPPMPAPPTEKPPPIPSKSSAGTTSHSTPQKTTRSSQLSLATSGKPVTLRTSRSTSHMTKTSSGAHWAGERPKTDLELNRLTSSNNSILAQLQASLAAANRQSLSLSASSTAANSSKKSALASSAAAKAEALDIALLREKSKNLDLPLISALCNDRSLLKQTKVLADGKHARHTTTTSTSTGTTPTHATSSSSAINNNTPSTLASTVAATATLNSNATSSSNNQVLSNKSQPAITTATTITTTPPTTTAAAATVNGNNAQMPATPATSNNNIINNVNNGGTPTTTFKYHSNSNSLSATLGSASKARKALISHRHPNDKLPPLPMQLAEANNYVMDPAVMLKHHQKSHNNA